MSINQIRSALYLVARMLGWFNAGLRGTVGQRVARVVTLRFVGSLLNRFIR